MKQKPKARKLILDLMLASEDNSLSAQQAVLGCKIFGISENSARVALARLSSEGMITVQERGSYALSDQAHTLADDVAAWRTKEDRLRPWKGEYLGVHCAGLGRSDRAATRRRARALDMLGFRELKSGLFVRPDNIEKDAETVEARLRKLGLDKDAPFFIAARFDALSEARIRRLWDCRLLSAVYRKMSEQLQAWPQEQADKPLQLRARDAFLFGGEAIRLLVYDPLLPEGLIDAKARKQFFAAARAFDGYGKSLWQTLYRENTGLPAPFGKTPLRTRRRWIPPVEV